MHHVKVKDGSLKAITTYNMTILIPKEKQGQPEASTADVLILASNLLLKVLGKQVSSGYLMKFMSKRDNTCSLI